MTDRPHVLFITYNGLLEPLGQRQGLAYLESLVDRYRFTVLSFEKARGAALAEGRRGMLERLAPVGIAWHPLAYHKRPTLMATAWDVAAGARRAVRIVREEDVALVHARAYVPAAIAWLVGRRTGVPWIFDVRGLLPEEYVDGGIWREGSLPHRLTKRAEVGLLRDAAGLVTLTDAVRPVLEANPGLAGRGDEVPWEVIPCCVRTDEFEPGAGSRERIREELGAGKRPVLVYAGSVGTWYLLERMIAYFRAARETVPDLLLLLMVNGGPEVVAESLREAGVSADDVRVVSVRPEEVPDWLGAADAGIGFYRPGRSRVACSPTKVAEYLTVGLPAVINGGIGDSDRLADSGVVDVVDDLSDEGLVRAAGRLPGLLERGGERARLYALEHFSIEAIAGPAYARLYEEVRSSREIE